MMLQSHNAAAAATTSEGMSAASRPLDDHPNVDAAPAEEKPSEEKVADKTNTAASARLEELPSEITTIIADQLDTKSLNQLRLCCKKIAAASSYTFKRRVPTSLTFFFMQPSMERLALLAENDRWNKHFEALEMLSSAPETSRFPEKGPPCWTTHSRRHLRSYRLHGLSPHSNRAARAAQPRFGGGTLPNVHTLTMCLNKDGYNLGTDATQHSHLPALYTALPNLNTLHLTHMKTGPRWKTSWDASPSYTLADYAPPAGACRLSRLYIKHSEIKTSEELLAVMRTHRDTLETVKISESSVDSLKELRLFLTGDEAPPLLREVLLENVHYWGPGPGGRVKRWRWDREGGVVDEDWNEEMNEIDQMILERMQAGTFDISDLDLFD